jgi:hypothetical protein
VQFHVEIKLQGARHQTPSIQIAWTFCMKVDKKYFKHYIHIGKDGKVAKRYASTSKLFHMYCFG